MITAGFFYAKWGKYFDTDDDRIVRINCLKKVHRFYLPPGKKEKPVWNYENFPN